MEKGYNLDPVEIELSLRRTIEKNKLNFIGTKLVPPTYTVVMDESVYDEYGDLLHTLGRMLGESIDAWIQDKGYQSDGGIQVLFEKGDTQKKGFLVRVSYQVIGKRISGEARDTGPSMPDGEGGKAVKGEECDTPVAELVEGERVYPLTDKGALMGRGEECDIRIWDDTVSDSHARLRVEYGRVTLEDLSSTNGTRVNLKRVRKAVLGDGDKIFLGSVGITFRLINPAGTESASSLPLINGKVPSWRRSGSGIILHRGGDK